VLRQREVMGREETTHKELMAQGRRLVASHRARAQRSDNGRRALTVHQAKDREFDGVVVIWPYTVGQDAEGKRRLLYNAVTRAKKWCEVIVQGKGNTAKPPLHLTCAVSIKVLRPALATEDHAALPNGTAPPWRP
jgi:superfamily I DNA/RNA helicase